MRLLVGRIGKAHGILGEATIEVRTDDAATRFALGAVVETDSGKSLTVDSVRVHNGILLLGFEGIASRNDIEALRNTLLYADVDIDAPGEDDEDYHVLQLIGCVANLEDGSKFGEVSDVLNLPGQDVLAIKTEKGEVLVPFVHQLVPVVDIKGKIVMDMGTGTGILGILASMIGCGKMIGIDNDSWCYENAQENIEKNNIHNFEMILGDAGMLKSYPDTFDVFIANINRHILLADIKYYVKAMRRPSTLLLSGFYSEDIADLVQAASAQGLTLTMQTTKDNWAALCLQKK